MADKYSYIGNADPEYIDQLYDQFRKDPESVDPEWRKFFEGFEFASRQYGSDVPLRSQKEINVLNLIYGYRTRGHLFTKTNPVRERRKYAPTLDIENFGLEESDLDEVFQAGSEVGLGPAKLRDIIDMLKQTYCQAIGAEYVYMRKPEKVKWLQQKMESAKNTPNFSIEKKKHILHKLNQAVAFESFLATKYVGQKRFSMEGAETLIPALDAVIEKGADLGIREFIMGMAHRGRLNVLANIINKTYEDIFKEFEGHHGDEKTPSFDGDVKYHMGYSCDVKTEKGETVHLSLMPNPSHLESVDPVAQGNARAKIDFKYNRDKDKVATILIHGDASIAGQGIVYEVVQMSELKAYATGGTIHMVINNQVGFTTNYIDARSSTYCTDVAKVILSPVFHVNGDDVESVVFATELALEFRQEFKKDVFIDLLCYRRHGHNETDEPRFTQPLLYKIIAQHPNPREIYFKKLLSMGSVEANLAKEMEKSFKKMLQERLNEVRQQPKAVEYSFLQSRWKGLKNPDESDFNQSPETGVPAEKLLPLAEKIASLPTDTNLKFFEQIGRILEKRWEMLKETDKLDWAMGELMAYATLLTEGFPIRMTGQDVERGTFAHRHATFQLEDSESEYIPLNHLSDDQARFSIYNSLLSEFAVLGFEFGYSLSTPYGLSIWEAQFGDFANGAQVIIDQYIASSETKWRRMSGLVMLLPHGYEGQGPEHSSARMERYLELCANNNMQIVYPTTPANIFHMLRRQMHRPFRIPLIVMSPKSLLRHPKCVSSFSDFTSGRVMEVIDDQYASASKVKKVLLCTGRLYYDLLEKQEEDKRDDIAIVRLEQIYPLPENHIRELMKKYGKAKWVWIQEEPQNFGAWPFILRKTKDWLDLELISRKESASPATGYSRQHKKQHQYLLDAAFDELAKPASKSGKKDKELVSKK